MENIKEQLEEVIKKNLPEKRELKECEKCNACEMMMACELLYADRQFNQALSQINPSLIADEVLKVFEEEKYGLLKKYSQWLEKHSYMDCDWWAEIPCSVDRFLEELHLSPNKENKIIHKSCGTKSSKGEYEDGTVDYLCHNCDVTFLDNDEQTIIS